MSSLDPRKSESITNQANYLQTGVTTMIMGSLSASIATGVWIPTQYVILGAFWIIAAAYKEIHKVVRHWTEKESLPSS